MSEPPSGRLGRLGRLCTTCRWWGVRHWGKDELDALRHDDLGGYNAAVMGQWMPCRLHGIDRNSGDTQHYPEPKLLLIRYDARDAVRVWTAPDFGCEQQEETP